MTLSDALIKKLFILGNEATRCKTSKFDNDIEEITKASRSSNYIRDGVFVLLLSHLFGTDEDAFDILLYSRDIKGSSVSGSQSDSVILRQGELELSIPARLLRRDLAWLLLKRAADGNIQNFPLSFYKDDPGSRDVEDLLEDLRGFESFDESFLFGCFEKYLGYDSLREEFLFIH